MGSRYTITIALIESKPETDDERHDRALAIALALMPPIAATLARHSGMLPEVVTIEHGPVVENATGNPRLN